MLRLFVKDNTSGNIHEYGTNQHDALILQDDGSLHYQNLQNGCGTMFPDEGYTFCGADGSDPRTREDYIQYGVEPYIDIGGNGEDHATCEWISVKDRLPDICGFPCLLCGENAFGQIRVFAGFTGYMERGKFKWHSNQKDIDIDVWTITHWMPLPHPPKEEARAITSVSRRK